MTARRFDDLPNTVRASTLPAEATERKAIPLQSGVLDYFPAALVEVARVSKAGNDQHNPGEPLHWARGKSNDHADSLQRHQLDHGQVDKDGLLHSAKVAWRALAQLQMELEATGAPMARGASLPDRPPENMLVPVDRDILTGDALWGARVSACDAQGEKTVHAVGVCSKCDRTYPLTSDIKRTMWFAALPPHIAEP